MRVVAGTARGRVLRSPAGKGTRPTSDRVREAVFDILTSMDVVDGAAVVDLFAGSGALGVEALSRGAASAVLVERDRDAVAVIRDNLALLEGGEIDAARRATVVQAEALAWAQRWSPPPPSPAPLVLADPPYRWDGWPALLDALAGWAGLLVAETGAEMDPGPSWQTVRSRRYGSTVVTIIRPSGTTGQPDGPALETVYAQPRGGT